MNFTMTVSDLSFLLEQGSHKAQEKLLDLMMNAPVADLPIGTLTRLAQGLDDYTMNDERDEDVIIKAIAILQRPDVVSQIDGSMIDCEQIEAILEDASLDLSSAILFMLAQSTRPSIPESLITVLSGEFEDYMDEIGYGLAILQCYKALRLEDQLQTIADRHDPMPDGVIATEPEQIYANTARQYLADLANLPAVMMLQA